MQILDDFSQRAARYISESTKNPVYPSTASLEKMQILKEPFPDTSTDALEVLSLLDSIGSPATVKSTGGRYFGFVNGSSLPAAMVAKLMATVWDQNACLNLMSPIAALLEEISSGWLLDIFGLPPSTATGFVTGCSMANFTALAAARHSLLKRSGWDVEAKGLFRAPEITVIAGEEVHVSVLKALNLIGFGRERIIRVPSDHQGRMIAAKIPEIPGPVIICLQAGNVNTGAFDPVEEICRRVKRDDVWIHIDGAFGLWAAASGELKPMVKGIEQADSLATDAHKWLNSPYDTGLVFVKDKEALFSALAATAAYLSPQTGYRDPFQFVPEMSREARGIAVWAALKSLGKQGLATMIESNCRHARQFAEGIKKAGFNVLNEVVLNQVLVSFGDSAATQHIIKKIQEDGTCWCGGTNWQGKTAMRISVSSWATTDEDVNLSLVAMLKIAENELSILRTM